MYLQGIAVGLGAGIVGLFTL